jgi:hypothetical protein
MLSKIINDISASYLSEAKNSPSLIEDMAAMEKYMAESYSGRVFIELLQNADDANSTSIFVDEFNEYIIFANNGRPFDENDIIAIGRTGASKKTRGVSIGYRGIGFKRTAYLTNEIIIYSNDVFFTFNKSRCSEALQKPIDKIPTVRIPFVVNSLDCKLENYVRGLAKHGYTTVFAFANAKKEQFQEEIRELNNGYFIFLRNIKECQINVGGMRKSFQIKRRNSDNYKVVSFSGDKNEQWATIYKESEAIALKLLHDVIVPCDPEETLFHCFLPTTEKSPYRLKINADFSTDPSRKHITLDALTQTAIDNVAALLFDVLKSTMQRKNAIFSQFVDIILTVNSFSSINQRLSAKLDSLIRNSLSLELSSGQKQSIRKCKLIPNIFENSEKNLLRIKSASLAKKSPTSAYYHEIPSMDLLIQKFSDEYFTPEEISAALSEKELVERLNSHTYAKILSFVASSAKHANVTSKPFSAPHIFLPTDSGVVAIEQVNNMNFKPKASIKKAISENLSPYDASILSSILGIESRYIYSQENELPLMESPQQPIKHSEVTKRIIPVVAKWRTAEQQCVELEKHLGNNAIDVSRQNVGYDVESTTPDGEKRYIEVKLVNSGNGAFTITNNEYTAAHQQGDKYIICLITPGDRESKVLYINNPLKNLLFEKRVRQWEWYCENYTGEELSIQLR